MPFLQFVGILDFFVGLVLPYKFDDVDLPDKNTILSKISDENDPESPFRSTLTKSLVRLENKDTNIYKEFAAAAKKYWYFKLIK